jgi:hypothetical protein
MLKRNDNTVAIIDKNKSSADVFDILMNFININPIVVMNTIQEIKKTISDVVRSSIILPKSPMASIIFRFGKLGKMLKPMHYFF